ncbi:MAG: glycosyltransferase family 39 protein, partial [Candidatus Omnitrophota bacterium]
YPMNAEALFAYPVLFLGDTRWVDAMQIPVGLWTAGVTYLLARFYAVRRAMAFFLAGMFFLTPIVIAQMGVNYIDLTCAGFLASSLYLLLRFLNSSRPAYLYLAFASVAAMMGMKYHLLFFGLVLAAILLFVLIRQRRFVDAMLGFVAVVGVGLGWHWRNYIVFSDWLYPARMTAGTWKMQAHSMGSWLLAAGQKIDVLFLGSVTNGTYDGGFGAIYGFIAFSICLLFGWRFLLRKKRWIKGELLLWGVVLALLFVLVPVGRKEFPWVGPRMLLVVWPIVLIIFGRIIFVVNRNRLFQRVWMICCLLGLLLDARAVLYSGNPSHHWWGKIGNSEFESYRYSVWYEGRLGPIASALDEMTQSLHRPATVFLASSEPFFSAPFYGRFLQTRIINFDAEFKGDPDFLVYVTISNDPLVYVGKYRKTWEEAESCEYRKVFSDRSGMIFAARSLPR